MRLGRMEGELIFRRRVGKVKQVIPGVKPQDLDVRAKPFPHMCFATELLTAILIQAICQFKDLVNIKGQEC